MSIVRIEIQRHLGNLCRYCNDRSVRLVCESFDDLPVPLHPIAVFEADCGVCTAIFPSFSTMHCARATVLQIQSTRRLHATAARALIAIRRFLASYSLEFIAGNRL